MAKNDEAGRSKSEHAQREEEILKFWQENGIFEKALAKDSPQGEFVFYEGPPTANGRPGIHHLEARAFKDLIPRYKTMQGYHVARKAGWDTHGLPVELEVEKELGLKSKKEIEEYGLTAFNQKCRESVGKYMSEWRDFTDRVGFWADLDNAYATYQAPYMESLWHIMKQVEEQGLFDKDYRVVPWCPRCGTGLSSHELAQGYRDVKDLSVFAKFKVQSPNFKEDTYLLAWTTTPWTLPGNVALVVREDIEYVAVHYDPDPKMGLSITEGKNGRQTKRVEIHSGTYILAKDIFFKNINSNAGLPEVRELLNLDGDLLLQDLKQYARDQDGFFEKHKDRIQVFKGKDLAGLEYEPLYPFMREAKPENIENAYKVYAVGSGSDFVNTEDGTGVVHTAVMYGQEDFEVGSKINLPKYHTVDETGHFIKGAGFLEGKFVRDEETAIDIIKDLAGRELLFAKEKYTHSYPHCWRCKTALIYYARDSYYIRMSKLRDKLIEENNNIHWEPEHIRDGRFGEWLRELKDWAISRERYWGTPLPLWVAEDESQLMIGSVKELKQYTKTSGNKYWLMRHGEAENNTGRVLSSLPDNPHHLTEKGKGQIADAIPRLKEVGVDLIISSDFVRTRETAELVAKGLGLNSDQIVYDERLREVNHGDFNGRPVEDYYSYYKDTPERFSKKLPNGEDFNDVKRRMGEALYDIETKYRDKKVLIISHESPSWLLIAASTGADLAQTIAMHDHEGETRGVNFINNAEVRPLNFVPLPHNADYELDLHRPHIDEVVLKKDGQEYKRVSEVMDVWFDSGSMPFAQHHYLSGQGDLPYPADFISEAIDQTRGWFYTLLAVGVLMGRGAPYKNVICLGHLLDEKGQKMSKSIGNVVDPWLMMDKYGADVLRFWMYSISQPGEPKNFDEKTVQEVVNKVVNMLLNVTKFYQQSGGEEFADRVPLWDMESWESGELRYEDKRPMGGEYNDLDHWIIEKLHLLVRDVTINLDKYRVLEPARAIRDFIADLSQWYIKNSRDEFKVRDFEKKQQVLATTRYVLVELSKLMAPFMPFLAEYVFQQVGDCDGGKRSVHQEDWPQISNACDLEVIDEMKCVRSLISRVLERRASAGIRIRQPLPSLKIKGDGLAGLNDKPGLKDLIGRAVNVKKIIVDSTIQSEIELDTNITPELQEEGDLRDLIRELQEQRKKGGLKPGEPAELSVSIDRKEFVTKHETALKEAVSATGFNFTSRF
ncbi:MAG: class I tRNA ligase family protein [Patescibacteria group bacterium]|nr:class I tRNA ligase family protein [Patescibacteria group bacterium]